MAYSRFALKAVSALIASGISALIGLAPLAHAEPACGLADAARYQEAISAPTEEGSPAYFLRTAEAFIAACPDRFEVRDAHLVAARAALDSGLADISAAHYDAALASGAQLSPSARMDQAIVLMATGDKARAREARNLAISGWLATLDATDAAKLAAYKVSGGTIYSVRYTHPDPGLAVTALWMGVPTGAGLPSSILIRNAPQRAAWRSLREGTDSPELIVAERLTCRSAALLGEVTDDIALEDIDRGAIGELAAYLAHPDTLLSTSKGEPIAACLSLNRMMHVPGQPDTSLLR
mgnify:CR=1 FL=1|tara:strand:+ start:798 stop:1679 length:882 start_codon:yes stop_codon:yes gene_type:complete